MPPKKAPAKSKPKAKAESKSESKIRTTSDPSRAKSPRNKKEPDEQKAKDILVLRNQLLDSAEDENARTKIHEACMGMYRCSKDKNQVCLDTILNKLKALDGKKGGGKSRSRSRSRSKSRSRK